jgi:hypothetical protein
MTRQYIHQQRYKAKGLCITCGKPRDPASPIHCETHLEAARTQKRNAYRKEKGIPADAPVSPRGRKRKGHATDWMRDLLATLSGDDLRCGVLRHCIDNKWSVARLATETRLNYSTIKRFLDDPDLSTVYTLRLIAKATGLQARMKTIDETP